jgi:hypothetical protein
MTASTQTAGQQTHKGLVDPTFTVTCRGLNGTATASIKVQTCDKRQTVVEGACVDWVPIVRFSVPAMTPYQYHVYGPAIGIPSGSVSETSPGWTLPVDKIGKVPGLKRLHHYYSSATGDHFYSPASTPPAPSYVSQPSYDFAYFATVEDQNAPLNPIYQWSKAEGTTYQDHLFSHTADASCTEAGAAPNCGGEFVVQNDYQYEGSIGSLYQD